MLFVTKTRYTNNEKDLSIANQKIEALEDKKKTLKAKDFSSFPQNVFSNLLKNLGTGDFVDAKGEPYTVSNDMIEILIDKKNKKSHCNQSSLMKMRSIFQ